MKWKGWTIFAVVLIFIMFGEIYFRDTVHWIGIIATGILVLLFILYDVFQHKFNKPYR